jgi:hypothetical protein
LISLPRWPSRILLRRLRRRSTPRVQQEGEGVCRPCRVRAWRKPRGLKRLWRAANVSRRERT